MLQWLGLAGLVAGLLLFVRVMFFGVRRRIDEDRLVHRRWPLSAAAFLMVAGAMLYQRTAAPTTRWIIAVLLGAGAALGAWWWVRRSETVPSSDPEDDPRFRFQGHVARVIQPIEGPRGGRIVFDFDGKRHDFRALWSASLPEAGRTSGAGIEVVIETVEGDIAYVEPWATVEERL